MNCLQSSCLRNVLLLALLSSPAFPQTDASQPVTNAARSSSQQSKLSIEGDPTLPLDPVCSACQGAYLDRKLRNDGAKAVPLSFSHGPITSTPEGKPFPATVEIFPLLAAKSDPPVTSLPSHGSTMIRVRITGVLGQGEWKVPLRNQGQDFVSIKVTNPRPDFAVKLESPTPDNPEVTFERGKPATLTLRNDSDTPYSVVASYAVNSRLANLSSLQTYESTSESLVTAPDKPCIVKLPAHSTVPLTVMPREEWFALPSSPVIMWTWRFWAWRIWTLNIHPPQWAPKWGAWGLSRIGALLKDQTAEGRLLVQMASTSCPRDPGAPLLSFKVNTHLAAFSKDMQSLGGFAIIFFVLLLGGVFSLCLNFILPMQSRRHNLKESLQQAGRKITDLSMELDSRVRVPVGVERQRLAQRIKSLSLLNTQYGPEFTDIEQSLERLTKRLDLLEQMQLSLAGYSRAQQRDLPATSVRKIEAIRKQALDLLQKSDPGEADLQKVVGLIQEIEHLMAVFEQADAAFARQLFDDLTRRKNQRVATSPAGPLVFPWTNPGFVDLAKSLDQELSSAPPDLEQMRPELYAPLDALRNRLTLLEKYQKILEGNPAPTAPFLNCSERLRAELRDNTWDSLGDADRLIREMQENFFPEDVIAHVAKDHVKIKVDRILVQQFEPATFSLEFANEDLKDAAACEEFTYRWNFNDDFTEDGWNVSHYFQKPTKAQPLGWFRLLKRIARERWQRLLLRIQTGKWEPTPPETHDPYNVRVTLVKNYDGAAVPNDVFLRDGPLKVEPPFPPAGHALLAELVRLVLALGLAVLGLVAGAKDQILKLDVVPALIAIFLLGVGADQIKNLLTQHPADK
jgi:hypothetical protein